VKFDLPYLICPGSEMICNTPNQEEMQSFKISSKIVSCQNLD